MKPEFKQYNRRGFFGALSKAAVIGLAASQAQAGEKANPFAYDLSRFQRTDPKLLSFVEAARWSCPHEDSRRLAVAHDGQIYICAGQHINSVTRAGESQLELALPGPASCVAVSEDGTIFAGLRNHIEVFNSKGTKLAAWESPAAKAWFSGLAASGRDVFAADSGQRVVLRYNLDGKIIGEIGRKNAARNVPGFVVPSPFLDVILDRDGLLRVNNIGRHCVEVYTRDGGLQAVWGRPSAAIDGFCGCCNPIAIAVLADGRIITCEKGIPRVKIYTASGEFESVVAGAESFAENAHACTSLNDCIHGGLDAAADSEGTSTSSILSPITCAS